MPSKSNSRRSRVLLPVALALVLAGAVAGWALASAASAPTATRFALAQATHVRGAPGRTLGLSRVVIPPGGKIALHHHEGTQTAYIKAGVLTYTVHAGQVRVRSGLADQNPHVVKTISAGETGRVPAGDWLVEQPADHHSAANHGKHRVVIYLATLLRHGAPPSTPG